MKITNVISKSISAKLITLFLAVSLIPIAIIGYTSYLNSKKALLNSIESNITSVINARADHISDFVNLSFDVVSGASTRNQFRNYLYNINNGIDVNKSRDGLELSLEQWQAQSNVFYRAKILNIQGDVVATTKDVFNDLGTSRKDKDFFIEGKKGPYITDPYIAPDDHTPLITFACPIYAPDSKTEVIGVLLIHQATDAAKNKGEYWGDGVGINRITLDTEGMGNTGETYLINEEGLILSPTRLSEDVFLKRKVNDNALKNLLSASKLYQHEDYRGITTLGMAKKIQGTRWYLVGEFDQAEVLAPVKHLGNIILIFSAIVFLVVVFLAFFISQYFTRPITNLTVVAKAMALGDLDQKISVSIKDEIGQLADSFKLMQKSMLEKAEKAREISEGNLMIDIVPLSDKDKMGFSFQMMVSKLRTQLQDISEGINVLASSSSEIMASVTQMASSSAETATSVGETTTTVEEVKQTALVSNNKAKMVSENAFKMTEISFEGNKAIANTIEGMTKIKNQMNAIASMVVKLSEQSQTIGEITATVTELAEQSNLLAVNAAIEAAKAGEQGKGFTVVAQEIKLLANRSKEATAQVRTILRDIQKSISSAVMATEEGNKAVEDGLKLTNISGETIKTLSDSITEASGAAIQIAASSQQQLEGMDQMVIAMESIREASLQAVTSNQQSVESVNELQKLGQKLDQLMKQYNLGK